MNTHHEIPIAVNVFDPGVTPGIADLEALSHDEAVNERSAGRRVVDLAEVGPSVTSSSFEASLSAIDEARFGVRTAKATLSAAGDVPALLEFCRANSVTLAIVRCSTLETRAVQLLEGEGFFLADTLIYYRRDLIKSPIPSDTGRVQIRPFRPGEEEVVGRVAAEAFHDFRGHYHADPYLEPEKCDQIYIDWAVRSCISREVADEVLVADEGGEIVGFTTLQLVSPDEGTPWLSGVMRAAQGRGIYNSLRIQGMNWFLSKGVRWMTASTQVSNVAVQKVWVRLGFEPTHSNYTFHKWFHR